MTDNRDHIVVVGAGVSGLETALALNAIAHEYVSVELIAPEREFTYRPLAVAEPFQMGEVRRFPLDQLVQAAGAELRNGSLVGVDADAKRALLADGQSVAYDMLVLALGGRPREAVPGALTFRGQEDGGALANLLERVTAGQLHRLAFVAPPGASWLLPLYELAFISSEYLSEHMTRGVEIVIAHARGEAARGFRRRGEHGDRLLSENRGIHLETATAARSWACGRLSLEDGRELPADAGAASLRGRTADRRYASRRIRFRR